jgi:hypothetical protein
VWKNAAPAAQPKLIPYTWDPRRHEEQVV